MDSTPKISNNTVAKTKKQEKAAKLAAYPSASDNQRKLGEELPRLEGKSSGKGKGRRDVINEYIDAFNSAQTTKQKRNLLLEIGKLATIWHDKFKGNHFFNADYKAKKAAMIYSLKSEIEAELNHLDENGEPSPRRSLTKLPVEELLVAEEAIVSEEDELIGLLTKQGYKVDRKYCSFKGEAKLNHVGWKLHVNAGQGERFEIIKRLAFLRQAEINHKFDVGDKEGVIDKFLTVYPPTDASEEFWSDLVEQITSKLSGLTNTAVKDDMEVGLTKPGSIGAGKAFMRHGQNTPLLPGMVTDLVHDTGEKWNGYAVYKPLLEGVVDEGLQLLCSGNTLFFNKKPGNAIQGLSPATVYMAILVNGKIVPDKREEPNPGNAPLPKGLRQV